MRLKCTAHAFGALSEGFLQSIPALLVRNLFAEGKLQTPGFALLLTYD